MKRLATLLTAASLYAADGGSEYFESKVRPVLAEKCYSCHTQSKLGGLDLSSRATLLTGGKSGPAIVPGQPAQSLLIRAVRQHDSAVKKMPPAGAPLPEAEIAAIEQWIRDGAPWPEAPAATVQAHGKVYKISDQQRKYWAFQPVRPLAGSIDTFLEAKWKEKGITPAPFADRRTLIRRATLDLTGLPATAAEIDAFVADKSPNAWDKVIDRLLASPAYGQRWGRMWLDIARYSDDKLNSTMDEPLPNAWRYRDWVIDAFNRDLPYDTFIKAQLAGDLLGKPDLLPGLGLYGLSPEFQDDRVDVTTRGFLGLTVACAQCHDHKFDPIPTKDYYSLLGIFNSSKYKEYPLAPAAEVQRYEDADKALTQAKEDLDAYIAKQRDLVAEMLAMQADRYILAAQDKGPLDGLDGETLQRWKNYLKKHADDKIEPAAFRDRLVAIRKEKLEIDEKNLIRLGGSRKREDLAGADLLSLPTEKFYVYRDFFNKNGVLFYTDAKLDRWLLGSYRDHLDLLRTRVDAAAKARPERYAFLHGLTESEKPHNEHVYLRGNKATPGEEAPRGWLAVLSKPEKPELFTQGSGRLQLAEHIASRENPLTARVMANRLWQGHFGEGIVRTASNFGLLGERPSHPELLDYLAARLIESGWSLKAVHRDILRSQAYRLSAAASPAGEKIDAENRLFWHFPTRRLDAEALRDSILAASGQLDLTAGGQATPLDDPKNHRRTVYGFVSRRHTDTMLNLFDFPNPNATSERRVETNVPLQRLFLLNSPLMLSASEALTARLEGPTDAARIANAYRRIYGRAPSRAESQLGLDFLAGSRERWPEYLQVLLSSNEFLYLN